MDKEVLLQQAVYAALEAHRLPFGERLQRRSDQPFLKRLGKAAVGSIVQPFLKAPQVLEEAEGNYSLVNSGYENIVYAAEEKILKVNIRTLSSDETWVIQEARKRQEVFAMCKNYMGRHWVDTKYKSRPYMDRFAVEATQPQLQPEAVFTGVVELLDYSNDEDYIDELERLISCIGNLYQNTGFYPDILGRGNIALTRDENQDPRLVILDTEPASPLTQEHFIPNQNIVIGEAIDESLSLWRSYLDGVRDRSESPVLVPR